MGLFSAASVFDSDVEKATDEKNTSEDWSIIMDVCDKIKSSQTNCKEGLKSIIKRLSHPDPHVAIQAVTLLDACVNNCGKQFHLEIASREFEQEFRKLLKTSQPKIADKLKLSLKKWAESDFKIDPQLNLIPSLYNKLKQEGTDFPSQMSDLKTGNPQSKDQLSAVSLQEIDDIAKAIELSLKDTNSSVSATKNSTRSLYPSTNNVLKSGITSMQVVPKDKYVKALYDFEAVEDNELTFYTGEIIKVLDDSDKNWWRGANERGEGLFPANFVTTDLRTNSQLSNENEKASGKESVKKETRSDFDDNDPGFVTINPEKIDELLHLLHEADTTDETTDTDEMLNLEAEVLNMSPFIDSALEKADVKHAQLTQLSSRLVDAFNLYHSLMREPFHTAPQTTPFSPPPPQGMYSTPMMPPYSLPPEQQYINAATMPTPSSNTVVPSHPHLTQPPPHQFMTLTTHPTQHVQQLPQQPNEDTLHNHNLTQTSYPLSMPGTHYSQNYLPPTEMVHTVYQTPHMPTSLPPSSNTIHP